MVELSIKDRVYEAAERISADRNPTVATVREAASVSNGDATRYLKEWRDERAAAGSTIAALPQPLTEHALRLAGMMWAEASITATAHHAQLETLWRDEKAHLDQEVNELVQDLDSATGKAAEATQEYETGLRNAQTAAAEHEAAEVAARGEFAKATAAHLTEKGLLVTQLAEARAIISTLQDNMTALIARIPNETPPAAKR